MLYAKIEISAFALRKIRLLSNSTFALNQTLLLLRENQQYIALGLLCPTDEIRRRSKVMSHPPSTKRVWVFANVFFNSCLR